MGTPGQVSHAPWLPYRLMLLDHNLPGSCSERRGETSSALQSWSLTLLSFLKLSGTPYWTRQYLYDEDEVESG